MLNEFTFYLPLVRDSDRLPIGQGAFDQLEQDLVDIWGGYTRKPNVDGAWKDASGAIIRDTSAVYCIAVEDFQRDTLREFIHGLNAKFDQQCIYLAMTSERVELLG